MKRLALLCLAIAVGCSPSDGARLAISQAGFWGGWSSTGGTSTAGLPMSARETTAATTYYVATTGSDSNGCTDVSAPCLTGPGALNKIPKNLKHDTIVSFGSGTFDGFVVEGFAAHLDSATGTPGLSIEGTMGAPTLASGVTSGTIASSTAIVDGDQHATFTVTGAGWTVNDLRGKWFRPDTGTGSGFTYLVQSNTATAVTVTGAVVPISAGVTTFQILEPKTTITCNLGRPAKTRVPWITDVAAATNQTCVYMRNLSATGITSTTDADHFQLKGFTFSGGAYAVDVRETRGAVVGWNRFSSQTGTGTSSGIVRVAESSSPIVRYNYATPSASQYLVTSGTGTGYGGTRGLTLAGNLVVGGGVFSTGTSTPIDGGSFNYNVSLSGNAPAGIYYFEGTVSPVQMTSNYIDANAGASGACFQIGAQGNSSGASLGGTFRFGQDHFNGCHHGVIAYGPAVDITASFGTFAGTGHARFGLTVRNGATARIASMSITGTLGDLSIDDSTAITYATAAGANQVSATEGSILRNAP
jgi:hypothetical protein